MWTDSHCHVPYEDMGEPSDVIAEAKAAGVTRLISVGTDAAQSAAAIKVAAEHGEVWATVGLHPHDASQGLGGIRELMDHPKVVAVGECGLDYHYDRSPREAQREAFEEQVRMANELDLALVVHSREAWDDTLSILSVQRIPDRTVFHCFTGGPEEARRCLDVGGFLSFSGIVTFKGAADVREAAAMCPLDRLLVETDAPYLAPVPHRGRPNTPAFVPLVGAGVAAAKGIDVDAVEHSSWANAAALFRLPV